jgi:hypothetical protein
MLAAQDSKKKNRILFFQAKDDEENTSDWSPKKRFRP